MTPGDFLKIAKRLAPSSPLSEAIERTRVNRAYYAAFLQARGYLRRKLRDSKLFSSGSVHAAVIGTLRGRHSSHDEQDAADTLDRMKQRRGTADYELVLRRKLNWSNEATDQITEAEDVFRLLP